MISIPEALADLKLSILETDIASRDLSDRRKRLEDNYSAQAIQRRRFNSWAQSKHGKAFKRRLHRSQHGRCANPLCPDYSLKLSIGKFHIDHIKPLSKYPWLALNPRNLQLLCSECNLKKGAKDLSAHPVEKAPLSAILKPHKGHRRQHPKRRRKRHA